MKEKRYFLVHVGILQSDHHFSFKIKEDAGNIWKCQYIEDFVLDDDEIQNILGNDNLISDIIPEHVISKIENSQNQKDKEEFNIIFYGDNAASLSLSCLEYINKIYPSVEVSRQEEEWKDGITEWKKHYSTINVTEDINIYPAWQMDESNRFDLNKIFINPGQGFGTGGHETTWMCLKLLDELMKQDKNLEGECLDLGCGSGILGITTMKKSDLYVTFSDVDIEAMDNCLENLTLNFKGIDLDGHSVVLRDRLNVEQKYHLIFANILEQVLLDEYNFIMSALQKGGYLIVSGILDNQLDNIIQIYINLEVIKVESKNEWRSILFKKT